jgi:hypothetical protein
MTCISYNLFKAILKRGKGKKKEKERKVLAGRFFLADNHAKHEKKNGVEFLPTAKPLHLISIRSCGFQKYLYFELKFASYFESFILL